MPITSTAWPPRTEPASSCTPTIAAKKLLGWVDGLLDVGEKHYAATGKPLFSSHMLDLSEEPLEENVEISKRYLERMSAIDMTLEIELGITGGEEDGVDNSDADDSDLYTKPEEVAYVYDELMKISDRFTVAAAFGNVHGVYKPGNVKLKPSILRDSQEYIQAKLGTGERPVDFVFHGGSGSSPAEIAEAISYGVVKMNIDTDLQWAIWDGIRAYEADKHDYLQGQIGNPDGPDKPNKKYYDPRMWLRAGEVSFVERSSRPSPSSTTSRLSRSVLSEWAHHEASAQLRREERRLGRHQQPFPRRALDLGDADGADQHPGRRRPRPHRVEHAVDTVLVGDVDVDVAEGVLEPCPVEVADPVERAGLGEQPGPSPAASTRHKAPRSVIRASVEPSTGPAGSSSNDFASRSRSSSKPGLNTAGGWHRR